mmetsp:Transcript_110272/g.355632  ORF Transcript_110272/g.355632 Transcript_110272/m.355632 type:complete len:122 (-) Transcript_110272:6-371(-)
MLFGRIAAASRAAAVLGAQRAVPLGFPGAQRTATTGAFPKLMSIRYDGLFIKCCVAALVYFVPQDVVILGGLFWSWHSASSSISPKKKQADAEAALEAFKAKKGLDDLKVYKGRSTWHVTL